MAYINQYNPYNSYQPQMFPTMMSGSQQPTQMSPANSQNGIIWVQGEAGAKSYLVAPNTTVQLWDSESQVIYLKSADSVGMPSMRILDYTIRDNAPNSPKICPTANETISNDIDIIKKKIDALEANLREIRELTIEGGKSNE